jgi:hypothetical protein
VGHSVTGEIQLNNTSFATESSGLITVKNSKLDTDAVFPTFVGLILPFAYDTSGSPPFGFFECDGAAVSRTAYSDLFSAIGTTWGVGDGSTTFNLPDLQGAFLRGAGDNASNYMAKDTGSGTRYPFSGPSVGSFENDQFQGFQVGGESSGTRYGIVQGGLGLETATSASNTNYGYSDYNLAFKGYSNMLTAVADNTNGAPRKGTETRPFNAGINYCIKY